MNGGFMQQNISFSLSRIAHILVPAYSATYWEFMNHAYQYRTYLLSDFGPKPSFL